MNFQNKVNELRKKDILNFKTNYFMNKINNNALYLENDNAIICLTQDRDIYRLYFAFINLFDFENILKQLPFDKKISLEIITKGELDIALYDCVDKYIPYETTFNRMRAKCDEILNSRMYNHNEIQFATREDVNAIYDALNAVFFHHTSHLPNKKELLDLINNELVLCVKNDNKLASFIVYKPEGMQARFDQFLSIDKNIKNTMMLMDYFVSELKDKKFKTCYLWVDIVNNKPAQLMYKYYKFKSENLNSFVFSKLI